ncbi:MAG TPA: FtsQ-type POTRA domain-containing protein [Candidatus Limnocylindrales bacterium]
MRGRPAVRTVGRARAGGQARRGPAIRRRSAGLNPVRAGALLAMLGAVAVGWGLTTSTAFAVRTVDVTGAALSSAAQVRTAAGVGDSTNPFTLETSAIVGRLEQLPTVASADVSVDLLGGVAIHLVERRPILAWAVGDRRLLVDERGEVFADLPADPADAAVRATLEGLPTIEDDRSASGELAVGSVLDAVEFDVARRLGSLRPADVGSGATGLRVAVEDPDGFVVRPVPTGWTAVFGIYTPTLRPPSIVPGQVRLLASLLAGREDQIGRVLLASETDGTYEPR